MRQKLIQYIDLLFAGTKNAEDIKEEILQNTLDRFDDLVSQGKTPEAAYRLAIAGIGDLSELLNNQQSAPTETAAAENAAPVKDLSSTAAKLLRAVAIALYILCPIPLFILHNEIGLCGLLGMVAVATALIVFSRRQSISTDKPVSTKQRILMGINAALWIVAFVLYGNISSLTDAWYITWVIFPATACICGIIKCFFYLQEHPARSIISALIQLLVLALLICVLFGGICAVDTHKNQTITGDYTSTPSVFNSTEIKNIRIEWVSGSITVVPGNDQNITVTETGAKGPEDVYIVKHQGETLTIQYSEPRISIGIFNETIPSKDLTIYVPRQWICSQLKIDSVSATIAIEEIIANNIDLVNVSGSCEFTGCQVRDLEAETVSGEITYRGSIDILDFSTVSADCIAMLDNQPNTVEFESVSGDMALTMPAAVGYRLDWDSASGDFRCDYSGNSHAFGDYACEITADTVSGDVIIKQAA